MNSKAKYNISVGRSRLDTQWKGQEVSWEKLRTRLGQCAKTDETLEEYRRMSKDEKGRVKDIGGFVGGRLVADGRRKAETVLDRSLLTLDIDFGRKDTLGVVADSLAGNAWCIYSTHSHTPEAPRLRLVAPLSRPVSPDEYIALARRVASDIDIELFDDSTYKAERLMYWPSCPKDGEFVFRYGDGSALDTDAVLATYTDWRNVTEWPRSSREQRLVAPTGRKAEDPTTKPGPVGDFCRAYSISEAIAAFLPDVYEATDQEDRYTFKAGSTAAGAVVYEDKWLYSNHGTDPASQKLLNAFDLVRVHRFGAKDEDCTPDTPVNRLPSYGLMEDFAGRDTKVRSVKAAEIFKDFEAGDIPKDPEKDWRAQLEWKQRKGRAPMMDGTLRNFRIVLENDPVYKGAVVLDQFSGQRIITRDLPGHRLSDGRYWTDEDDLALAQYLSEAPYFAQGKQNIIDTARHIGNMRKIHPVRQYLDGLTWDGVPRLDTLIIDYLGAEDNPLTRALTRKHFCAAVRRVYRPGCKHDGVLSLEGPQGIGKSTLIKTMFGEWFSDTAINVDRQNETGMQLLGVWGLEMAEMTDYKKSSVEAYKNFISSQEDRIRIPYDRSYQNKPRQCVLFATTNEKNFLKGDTGNRRFWLISVGVNKHPALDVWKDLPVFRDQLWAEAKALYEKEPPELSREMEAQLAVRQAGANEYASDGRVDLIRAFMSEMVPADWRRLSRDQRREWRERRTVGGFAPEESSLIQRPSVCYQEIEEECLMMRGGQYNKQTIKTLLKYVGVEEDRMTRDVVYGMQRRWRLKPVTKGVTDVVTEAEIM